VRCVPEVLPIYNELVKASRRGSYWATLTVQGIICITSGGIERGNMFISYKGHSIPQGKTFMDDFLINLPGCSATMKKLPNGEYLMKFLELDDVYFARMANKEIPGLYRAVKRDDRWKASYVKNGKVQKEKGRLVAITDANHKNPDTAADTISHYLSNIPGKTAGMAFDDNGFDLHFTPGDQRLAGDKSIGGLINYSDATNPLRDAQLHPSAMALAKTMYHAKNVKHVEWVSEFGGSAVLTQAMKILVGQGVKLPLHTVFLHRPRSVPREALKFALQLELNIGRDFSKAGALDVIGNMGKLGIIYDRVKAGNGYTDAQAAWDVVRTTDSAYGLGKTVIAAPAIPALLAFGKYFAMGIGALKAGETGLSAIAPGFHAKLMSKFK